VERVDIEFDEDGIKAIFADVAKNIAAADARFRQNHEGYPVEVVEADVASAFPELEMSDSLRRDYATAVAECRPFIFNLTG
jgi:hypothetical protein